MSILLRKERIVMSSIVSKAFKGVKVLARTMRVNIKKKLTLPLWYGKRKEVKSWFFLYLCYSSFIIDVMVVLFGKSEWLRKAKIKVNYKNGLSLYFPFITGRYYSMMTNMMSNRYLHDFEKYYSRKVSLCDNDVVIDIGANLGRFSIPIFFAHPRIRVFAYEPDPYNYACLQTSVRANRLDNSRFKINQLAVYDKKETVNFSASCTSTRSSIAAVNFPLSGTGTTSFSVETTTLNDIFEKNNLGTCKVLKIDCEGSEYKVLETTPDTIFSRVENIILEIHTTEQRNPPMLIKFLENKGFDVKGEEYIRGIWEVYCVNRKTVHEKVYS